jgi:hypothetical protein
MVSFDCPYCETRLSGPAGIDALCPYCEGMTTAPDETISRRAVPAP